MDIFGKLSRLSRNFGVEFRCGNSLKLQNATDCSFHVVESPHAALPSRLCCRVRSGSDRPGSGFAAAEWFHPGRGRMVPSGQNLIRSGAPFP